MFKIKNNSKRILKILLLILVILISGFAIYQIHNSYSGLIQDFHTDLVYLNVTNFNYPFPIHADEWTHLAQIGSIIDGKFFTNPYSPNYLFHADYEIGYHLILAGFFEITSMNPVLTYQFFPAIFFIINSFFLFWFIKKITNNYYIAIFSILFFLAIPSNINFLGNWFATPLTFSIFLIYFFFISLTEFVKTKKKKYLSYTIILYLASLCYPIATVFITLLTLFYLLLDVKIYKSLRKYKTLLFIGAGILLVLILLFKNLFLSLVFNTNWAPSQFDYSLIFFYGILPTILAASGTYFVVNKNFNKLIILWPTICLVNLILYKLFNLGLFLPYERTLFYYLLGLVPLASIGLFYILQSIYNLIITFSVKYKKILALILILLLVFVTFYFVFNNYYKINEKNFSLMPLIEEQDYNALKFIGQNYGNNNIVLADNFISIAIYPVSKNSVLAIRDSNLGYGDPQKSTLFFMSSCEDKKKITEQFKINLVLSRFRINCSSLDEVYSNKDYIYKVI